MAIKKKTAKKKAHKKPGLPKRLTARNQQLINALCQVPAPTVKEAAASLKMSYGGARVMLTRPMVLEALEEAKAKITEVALRKAGVDATYVLRGSRELFERCMQHAPVLDKKGEQVHVKTPDGEIVPAFTFDSGGAGKALKLLGDHIEIQAFKENVQVDASKGMLEFFAGLAETKGPPSERGK